MDLDGARRALRGGDPAALLGLRECTWLDVKSGIYQLSTPRGVDELVKDVAAFANARTGGLVMIGYKTRKQADEEIIDALRPIPRDLVDLDQHRKLLRERIIPPVRDVEVDWIDCGDGTGVLFIDIPVQPQTSWPFVVPGPTTTRTLADAVAVAIPIREADGTRWLPRAELQRLVALGWSEDRRLQEEARRLQEEVRRGQELARAVTLMSSTEAPAAHEVGRGVPGWNEPFRGAHDELVRQGITLGEPVTDVVPCGPGVIQEFAASGSDSGWVLCALPPRQRPVLVVANVWHALQVAGSGTPDGDALSTLGFPVADPSTTRIIDNTAMLVDLAGGRWGPGRLRRATDSQRWRWQPVPNPREATTSTASRNWTSNPTPPQLRVRAVAKLPWTDGEDLEITPARRRQVADVLPVTGLSEVVAALSTRRGAAVPGGDWVRGPNPNALDRLSYSRAMTGPDGRTALTVEVMMALPTVGMASTVTCAELRVEDTAVWVDSLRAAGAPDDEPLELSPAELVALFAATWQVATELLPAASTADPLALRWASVPTVELWVTAERPIRDGQTAPELRDVLDLSTFGATDRDHLREMTITVPTAPGLDAAEIHSLARQATTRMLHLFGFLDATID